MEHRPNDLLSTEKAAVLKGVNRTTIRKACANGDLKAQQINSRAWAIKWRDLQKWEPKKVRRTKAEIEAQEGLT